MQPYFRGLHSYFDEMQTRDVELGTRSEEMQSYFDGLKFYFRGSHSCFGEIQFNFIEMLSYFEEKQICSKDVSFRDEELGIKN